MDALSITANLVILGGYFFAAFYVGPRITGTSLMTKLAGAGFFITCGLHHMDGAIHLGRTPGDTVSDMYTAPHMIAIDTLQALFIWIFIVGLANDLIWKPRRGTS